MDRLYTEKEIYERTGLRLTSLQKWRSLTRQTKKQVGPSFRNVRGRCFYRMKDVELFIDRESFLNGEKEKKEKNNGQSRAIHTQRSRVTETPLQMVPAV